MAEQTMTVTAFGQTLVWHTAHADGHAFANNGLTLIYCDNQDGVVHTLQHTEQRSCDFGHPTTHEADTNPTGGISRHFRAMNTIRFNDGDGKAHITFTTTVPGNANLRVAAVDYSTL
jgi:hypothetical protein